MAETILYLVRHGATDANLKRPYVLQGRGIDLPLSETGRTQATAVADFLKQFPLSRVYSSSMQRARETGESIAEHHGFAVEPVEGLEECDVGEWEGMNWDSIMREHPEKYRAFMDDPATSPYLGGESYGDVHRRISPILETLLRRHLGESIAVVAHNVVNRVYLAGLLNMEIGKARDIRQANACVNVIRHQEGKTELMTMNAFFHLGKGLF